MLFRWQIKPAVTVTGSLFVKSKATGSYKWNLQSPRSRLKLATDVDATTLASFTH